MQNVELGPGKLAFADLVHGRLVAGAPPVGKAGPVQVDTLDFSPSTAFLDDGSTPIHHGSKGVEE